MATGSHGTDQNASSRDDVTAEWRDDHLPSFFVRWHRQNEALLQETTAAIIAEAAVAPGSRSSTLPAVRASPPSR